VRDTLTCAQIPTTDETEAELTKNDRFGSNLTEAVGNAVAILNYSKTTRKHTVPYVAMYGTSFYVLTTGTGSQS